MYISYNVKNRSRIEYISQIYNKSLVEYRYTSFYDRYLSNFGDIRLAHLADCIKAKTACDWEWVFVFDRSYAVEWVIGMIHVTIYKWCGWFILIGLKYIYKKYSYIHAYIVNINVDLIYPILIIQSEPVTFITT